MVSRDEDSYNDDFHDEERTAANNPLTSQEELRLLAQIRPDLWEDILRNPNVYPDLSEWITQELALAKNTAPHQPQVEPSQQPQPQAELVQPPQPQPQSRAELGPQPQPQAELGPYPQTQQGPPAELGQPQPQMTRRQRGQLLLGLSIGVVVALAVIAGLAWIFLKSDDPGTTASAYTHAPQVAHVTDIGPLEGPLQLTPITPTETLLHYQSLTLVRVRGEATQAVVAVDTSSDSTYAQWVVPVADTSTGCSLSGAVLDCGGEDVFDIGNQNPVPIQPPKQENSGETSQPDTPDEGELPPDDDDALVQSGAAETPSTEGSEEQNDQPASYPIGSQPTSEVPFAIEGGKLLGANGAVIADLQGDVDAYWAVSAGKGDAWFVSDGRELLAVEGDGLLWRVALPNGSVEVNGFGGEAAPSWATSGGILVLGDPGGLSAYGTESSEPLWHRDLPVESFEVAAEQIVVSTDNTLVFLTFPADEGAVNEEQSNEPFFALPENADAGLSIEEVMNAPLEIPAECVVSHDGDAGDLAYQFEDGTAWWWTGYAELPLIIAAASPLVLNGEPHYLVDLHCHASPRAYESYLLLYDKDLRIDQYLSQMRAPAEPWAQGGFFQSAEQIGSLLKVTWSSAGTVGPPECLECETSPDIVTTHWWDGKEFLYIDAFVE